MGQAFSASEAWKAGKFMCKHQILREIRAPPLANECGTFNCIALLDRHANCCVQFPTGITNRIKSRKRQETCCESWRRWKNCLRELPWVARGSRNITIFMNFLMFYSFKARNLGLSRHFPSKGVFFVAWTPFPIDKRSMSALWMLISKVRQPRLEASLFWDTS